MMKQAEKEESYQIKLYMKFLSLRLYCFSKKELFALSSVRDLKQYRELLDFMILKVFSSWNGSMILYSDSPSPVDSKERC